MFVIARVTMSSLPNLYPLAKLARILEGAVPVCVNIISLQKADSGICNGGGFFLLAILWKMTMVHISIGQLDAFAVLLFYI